ncbi:MAG: thiol reductant ABC exporter subunit CydD [Clostridiales Family XIII bacterium]|jgi:thiol reductant ABC exporter CydD subunit|nr:thiol reductant ABC exporter subunit CydD [Clostridiales Family XIII bacterium]
MIDKNLWREMRRNRLFLFGTAATGFLCGFLILAQAWSLSELVDRVFFKGLALQDVSMLFAALFVIVTARAAMTWLEEWFALRLAHAVQTDIRQALLDKIERLGPVKMREEQTGELLNLLTEGLEVLHAYFGKYLPQLFKTALIPILFLIVIFPRDWITGVILLVTAPLLPMFMMMIGRWSQAATKKQWRVLGRMTGYFQDVLQGISTLKMLNQSERHALKVEQISEDFRKASLGVLRIAFLSALTLELFSTLSIAILAVGLGLRLVGGTIGFQAAFFVLLLAPEFYLPIRSLGTQYHASLNGVAAAGRVYAFLATDGDMPAGNGAAVEAEAGAKGPGPADGPGAAAKGTGGSVAAEAAAAKGAAAVGPAGAKGGGKGAEAAKGADGPGAAGRPHMPHFENVGIVFADVAIGYGGGREEALRGVSFSVAPGEKIGLIGPSGSGKSTVLNLLLGFIAPDRGGIEINGHSLSSFDMGQWRRMTAWVPQNPHLFTGTIKDNLLLGSQGVTDEAMLEASRLLGLDAFIEAMPDGYGTRVGQGGRGLSGGQRQLLAICRGWLRQAPLLLLDEATANLDLLREEAVQEALWKLMRGKTVIAAAHRLKTVEHMDRLIVLDSGLVREAGAPSELIGAGGIYADMIASRG